MSANSVYSEREENISKQLDVNFGGLQDGMRKLQDGYPDISGSIEELLDCHDVFPGAMESPTGNTFMPHNFDGKKIEGDPRFSDECWQAIILKGYPFPESYKNNPALLTAIDTSLEIQNLILSSNSYQDRMEEIRDLPIIQDAKKALEKSSGLRYHLEIFEQAGLTLDRFMQVIALGAPRRLQQIAYSIEEQLHVDRITEKIGNPMSRMRYEIDDRMFMREEL